MKYLKEYELFEQSARRPVINDDLRDKEITRLCLDILKPRVLWLDILDYDISLYHMCTRIRTFVGNAIDFSKTWAFNNENGPGKYPGLHPNQAIRTKIYTYRDICNSSGILKEFYDQHKWWLDNGHIDANFKIKDLFQLNLSRFYYHKVNNLFVSDKAEIAKIFNNKEMTQHGFTTVEKICADYLVYGSIKKGWTPEWVKIK